MEIVSREDKITMEPTGKFRKTSVITSEMNADELRRYREGLARRVEALEIEITSILSEIKQIDRIFGGAK